MNLKMPALKTCFERCGFSDVKTLLSSGNVTFTARPATEAALERRAGAALKEDLGIAFMTFVRSIDALRELFESDPCAPLPAVPGAKRVVTFLREDAAASRQIELPVELDGARVLCLRGTEVLGDDVSSPRGPRSRTFCRRPTETRSPRAPGTPFARWPPSRPAPCRRPRAASAPDPLS